MIPMWALGSEAGSPSAPSHRQNPCQVHVGGPQAGNLTCEVGKVRIRGAVGGAGHDGGDHGKVRSAGGINGLGVSCELLDRQPSGGQTIKSAESDFLTFDTISISSGYRKPAHRHTGDLPPPPGHLRRHPVAC